MATETENPRVGRRLRWFCLAVILLIGIIGVIAGRAHQQDARRAALAIEIQQAGGHAEQPKSLLESLGIWRETGRFPSRRTIAQLFGKTFNNQWIREHDYLRDFEFQFIQCDSITGDDLARLIDSHPLVMLNARNIVLTDEVLRAIRDNATLTQLLLGNSKYTDEQLAGLPLERLDGLFVAQTGVTPAGLMQVRRCRVLRAIHVDGSQLTVELADVLAALGTLREVTLFGPEVSDDHLRRLYRIKSLEVVEVLDGRTSPKAQAALSDALPRCKLNVPIAATEAQIPTPDAAR